MKKLLVQLVMAVSSISLFGAIARTQPTHTLITGYKYPANGLAGYAFHPLSGSSTGHPTVYDVAVSGSYHFQSGTSNFSSANGKKCMVLGKKNATNGAPVA